MVKITKKTPGDAIATFKMAEGLCCGLGRVGLEPTNSAKTGKVKKRGVKGREDGKSEKWVFFPSIQLPFNGKESIGRALQDKALQDAGCDIKENETADSVRHI